MNHLSLNSYNLGCPSEPSPISLCASEVIRDRTKSYKQPRGIVIIINVTLESGFMIFTESDFILIVAWKEIVTAHVRVRIRGCTKV